MSMNPVEGVDKLYISGLLALRGKIALQEAGITHILSVLRIGHDSRSELLKDYKRLIIPVDDVEDENLLSYLPETNKFIAEGLQEGAVLVHCAVGKSRSATCVVAYMMSALYLTPDRALAQLRKTRPFVEPNPGFWDQLKLYHSMGCPLTSLDEIPAYQRWAYEREVALSVACGRAPETLRFADEAEKPSQQSESELRCRKCRRVLATSTFIVTHETTEDKVEEETEHYLLKNHSPNPDQFKPLDYDPSKGNASEQGVQLPSSSSSKSCAHFFIHPLLWMKPTLERGELEGRLNCPNPKCGQNVGKYAWQGMPCSCGKWVTPAFSIGKARVDEVRTGKLSKKGPIGVELRSPANSSTEIIAPIEGSSETAEKRRDENL